MLEMIVDNRLMYVVTGGVTALGVAGKIISNLSLKRMVKAAENMSKSNHALMRLIRAKFEHACMVSEKVENVQVFVDKYLYEYRTLGMKLHSWRRLQIVSVGCCFAFGVLGAFMEYSVNGMNDEVIRIGAYSGILGVLLYLFHLTTDEKYRLDAARNYIVDYLENVCRHKYEKAYQKIEKVSEPVSQEKQMLQEKPVPQEKPAPPEKVIPQEKPKYQEPVKLFEEPKVSPSIKAVSTEEEKTAKKDVLIRQILEEFMA